MIFRDKEDRENPLDREEITDLVHVEGTVKGFNTILSELSADKLKGMKVVRVPFLEEKALPLECFDIIVAALGDGNPAKTQCIFSSQLGKSRTTLSMTVGCIIKAVQMTSRLNKVVFLSQYLISTYNNNQRSQFRFLVIILIINLS